VQVKCTGISSGKRASKQV